MALDSCPGQLLLSSDKAEFGPPRTDERRGILVDDDVRIRSGTNPWTQIFSPNLVGGNWVGTYFPFPRNGKRLESMEDYWFKGQK